MKSKKTFRLPVILMLGFCLALLACGHRSNHKEAQAQDTTQVLMQRISRCSRLYTSEYQLRKILVYSDQSTIQGSFLHNPFTIKLPFGKRSIVIPVTAKAKAYIDFSKIKASDIHRDGDKLEIILPDPEIALTSTHIDDEGVHQNVSLLRSRFSDDEITKIQQQGRSDIVSSLKELDIIENARLNAATLLIPIVEQLGYKEENVTITFRKGLTGDEFTKLIRYKD